MSDGISDGASDGIFEMVGRSDSSASNETGAVLVGALDVGVFVGDAVLGAAVVGAWVGAGEIVDGANVGGLVGASLSTASVGSADSAITGAADGDSVTATGASVGAVVVLLSLGAATGVKVKNGTSWSAAANRRNADVINSFIMIVVFDLYFESLSFCLCDYFWM